MAGPVNVQVTVRFWHEDGVWNAIAVDLPVAVFGATVDEARTRLREATQTYLNLAYEMGMAEETVAHLQRASAARHVVEEEQPEHLLGTFLQTVAASSHDCHA